MNGVDFVRRGHGDNRFDVQIRPDRLADLANQIGFVRLEAMQRVAVFVGINGDRADAQLVRRTKNADGNFAAVGHQQLADRFHESRLELRKVRRSRWPPHLVRPIQGHESLILSYSRNPARAFLAMTLGHGNFATLRDRGTCGPACAGQNRPRAGSSLTRAVRFTEAFAP